MGYLLYFKLKGHSLTMTNNTNNTNYFHDLLPGEEIPLEADALSILTDPAFDFSVDEFILSEDNKELELEDYQKTFFEPFVRAEKNGCLAWTGELINGKPIFRVGERSKRPWKRFHFAQYTAFYWHTGHYARPHHHITTTCGNDLCVNKNHLVEKEYK